MNEKKQKRSIAYGFWRFRRDELDLAVTMIETAREAGISHFDTADVYGGPEHFGAAESLLGEARRQAEGLFDGAEIATKIGVEFGVPYNSSREYIFKATEDSLQRLGVERIDLLYIHRPDMLAHPSEVADALDTLHQQGKVKSVGVSNYTPSQLEALAAYLRAPLAAHQVEFSLLHTAPLFDGTFDQAMRMNIALYAWSPLAGGRLLDGRNEASARLLPALQKMVDEKKACAPEMLALAFVLNHPAMITPIVGTKNPERLKAAGRSPEVNVSREEWYRLLETALGRRLP